MLIETLVTMGTGAPQTQEGKSTLEKIQADEVL